MSSAGGSCMVCPMACCGAVAPGRRTPVETGRPAGSPGTASWALGGGARASWLRRASERTGVLEGDTRRGKVPAGQVQRFVHRVWTHHEKWMLIVVPGSSKGARQPISVWLWQSDTARMMHQPAHPGAPRSASARPPRPQPWQTPQRRSCSAAATRPAGGSWSRGLRRGHGTQGHPGSSAHCSGLPTQAGTRPGKSGQPLPGPPAAGVLARRQCFKVVGRCLVSGAA